MADHHVLALVHSLILFSPLKEKKETKRERERERRGALISMVLQSSLIYGLDKLHIERAPSFGTFEQSFIFLFSFSNLLHF
jgi:hypothetical protein